jgi:nicotine blue oxidoreductase
MSDAPSGHGPGSTGLAVAGVILAAGRGERLGFGPKAFLEIDGETLLTRAIRLLTRCGLRSIVAVLPPGSAAPALPAHVRPLNNPHPEAGPLSSVFLALAELDARGFAAGALLIHHVDHPWVAEVDVRALLDAAVRHAADASPIARIVPTWENRSGHPIVVLAAGVAAIRAVTAPAATTLREVLARAGEIRRIPARGPGVVRNVNSLEDLEWSP